MATVDFVTETHIDKVAQVGNHTITISEGRYGDSAGLFYVSIHQDWRGLADAHTHPVLGVVTGEGDRKKVTDPEVSFNVYKLPSEAAATRVALALAEVLELVTG